MYSVLHNSDYIYHEVRTFKNNINEPSSYDKSSKLRLGNYYFQLSVCVWMNSLVQLNQCSVEGAETEQKRQEGGN